MTNWRSTPEAAKLVGSSPTGAQEWSAVGLSPETKTAVRTQNQKSRVGPQEPPLPDASLSTHCAWEHGCPSSSPQHPDVSSTNQKPHLHEQRQHPIQDTKTCIAT